MFLHLASSLWSKRRLNQNWICAFAASDGEKNENHQQDAKYQHMRSRHENESRNHVAAPTAVALSLGILKPFARQKQNKKISCNSNIWLKRDHSNFSCIFLFIFGAICLCLCRAIIHFVIENWALNWNSKSSRSVYFIDFHLSRLSVLKKSQRQSRQFQTNFETRTMWFFSFQLISL